MAKLRAREEASRHYYFRIINQNSNNFHAETVSSLFAMGIFGHFQTLIRKADLRILFLGKILVCSQCLKITGKVSFNIASEASYVYILSGQKFIKNAQKSQFWRI